MISPHYDAVVVGARAAGASTAMLLARAGLDVLVVDRGEPGADTLSTHALMRGAVLQLHRWGVLPRVIDAGTPAIRRATYDFAGEQLVIDIKPGHGIDALYAPRRTVLDPLLIDAAASAGADVRYGITVLDVRRDASGRVNGLEARNGRGERVVIDAGLVIGADGRRSTIAERVGAPVERRGRSAMGLVYGYWQDVPADGYEWMFRQGATAGVIPTNDGLTCVFAGASPGRIARTGRTARAVLEDVLRAAFPATAARVAAGGAAGAVRTFTGQPGHLRRSWGPGWALVGDAGYWKDPASAHGLTDALRDAELLARAVVEGAEDPSRELEALAGYQARRDALSAELFEVTDLVAELRWTDADVGRLLHRLSASMADEVEALAALDAVPVA